MVTYYFPGCKYTALSPVSSQSMQTYLKRQGVTITGCCRVYGAGLQPGDRAIVVCPTCLFNLREHAPQAKCVSLWEYLLEAPSFPWPDFGGEMITVQDCVDSNDNLPMRHAVRSLLTKMGFAIQELPGFPEGHSQFCNLSSKHTLEKIQEHCTGFRTPRVVCYCTGCFRALQLGGVEGIHILDLLTSNLQRTAAV